MFTSKTTNKKIRQMYRKSCDRVASEPMYKKIKKQVKILFITCIIELLTIITLIIMRFL